MIRDARTLSELRKNWSGVEALRSRLQRSAYAAVGVAGGTFPFSLADAAHNLPFVHAYAILNDVLLQLATEGHFTCKSIFLGELLKKSRAALPWRDFAVVSAGAARRNDVAHRGKLLGRGDCWAYIDAVRAELSIWGVL